MNGIVPFRILIAPRDGAGPYPVRVATRSGEVDSTFEPPEVLRALGERLLQPRATLPASELEALGKQLGRLLFTPRLRGMLLEEARAAAQEQDRLQIQLQVAVPDLAALPWEWLTIGTGRPWVPAVRDDYTLARVGRRNPPAPAIVVQGPLRVLVIGGAGQDRQAAALEDALAPSARLGRVAVELLPAPDLNDVRAMLASRQFHAAHVAAPVALTADERLVVSLAEDVDGFDLADVLGEHPTLRLVTLAGEEGDGERFSVAPALLGAVLMTDQIAAAVSLTAQLPAAASARFVAALYDDLALGAPLDLAVNVGRRAIFDEGGALWGAPQLRLLPGGEAPFALRPAAKLPGGRQLVPAFIVAALLVLVLLGYRWVGARASAQPQLAARVPTSEPFVLPNIPAILPTATPTPAVPPTPLPDPRTYVTYTVTQSDTLDTIAAQLGSDPAAIAQLNALPAGAPLRAGRGIVVPVYGEGAAAGGGMLITRAGPTDRRVALTFDVEIDDKSVYSILETLRARGVKATFFVTGRWVEAFPDAARAIVRDGHELGNHSYTHPYFSRIAFDGADREVDETERAVRTVTGATSRPYFRFPYGDSTADMLALIARHGYIAYHWSTDDAGFPAWLANVTADPASANGAIVLMHARADSAAALPGRLDQLEAAGLRPTTLGEALR